MLQNSNIVTEGILSIQKSKTYKLNLASIYMKVFSFCFLFLPANHHIKNH